MLRPFLRLKATTMTIVRRTEFGMTLDHINNFLICRKCKYGHSANFTLVASTPCVLTWSRFFHFCCQFTYAFLCCVPPFSSTTNPRFFAGCKLLLCDKINTWFRFFEIRHHLFILLGCVCRANYSTHKQVETRL